VCAQGQPERDERQVVQLARRAGEDGQRAPSLTPAPREAEQAPAEEVAREVLLGDGRGPCFPALPQIVEIRDDEIAQQRFDADGGERAVESLLRGRLVEPLEGLRQGIAIESRLASPGETLGGGRRLEGEPSRLRGRKALRLERDGCRSPYRSSQARRSSGLTPTRRLSSPIRR
jgi:hypothetical protein